METPRCAHVQNPDRVAAARRAIGEFGCQMLVLDDAFQHRRIGRDLDIVLLDALEPLGYEHVFPRGTLREPVQGLARADVIALSCADLLTADERGAIRDRVIKLSPKAVWVEVVHAPWHWWRLRGHLKSPPLPPEDWPAASNSPFHSGERPGRQTPLSLWERGRG